MASRIQTLHQEVSPISGKIKVRQYYDVCELYVNDVKQSIWTDNPSRFKGTYWNGVVSVPLPDSIKNPRVLMLGLGGGTIPKLFAQKYPESHIVSIELDPIIAQIAKDYFQIDQFPQIEVIIADANRWLEENAKKYLQYFDVLCLDTYISDEFNFNTKNKDKIAQFLNYLSPDGTIITNRIYDDENDKELKQYKKNLSEHFNFVNEIIIEGFSGCDNLVIYAQSPLSVN